MSQREHYRAKLIAGAVLVLVFSTGAIVSGAVQDSGSSAAVSTSVRISNSADLDEIGLTEAQRAAMDSLLTARQPQLDSIIVTAIRDLNSVLDTVDVEIRTLLSPAQIEDYERLKESASGPRAIRRTVTPSGDVQVDTIR